jgi:hypothetical protein
MLVDMNPVPQCMVVSSPLSFRLPINPNAADEQSLRASFLAFSSPLIGNVMFLQHTNSYATKSPRYNARAVASICSDNSLCDWVTKGICSSMSSMASPCMAAQIIRTVLSTS